MADFLPTSLLYISILLSTDTTPNNVANAPKHIGRTPTSQHDPQERTKKDICFSDSSFPANGKKQLIQSEGFQFPSRALLHEWGKEYSPTCHFCHERETLGHIQSRCKSLENGQSPPQFPQRNTRRSLFANCSTTLVSSLPTMLWRIRYTRSSLSA